MKSGFVSGGIQARLIRNWNPAMPRLEIRACPPFRVEITHGTVEIEAGAYNAQGEAVSNGRRVPVRVRSLHRATAGITVFIFRPERSRAQSRIGYSVLRLRTLHSCDKIWSNFCSRKPIP